MIFMTLNMKEKRRREYIFLQTNLSIAISFKLIEMKIETGVAYSCALIMSVTTCFYELNYLKL